MWKFFEEHKAIYKYKVYVISLHTSVLLFRYGAKVLPW